MHDNIPTKIEININFYYIFVIICQILHYLCDNLYKPKPQSPGMEMKITNNTGKSYEETVFYLIAVLCSTCIFTACSDDDPYVAPTKVEMYTASNGLKYTYGGTDRTDITVLYTPDATDPQKATLTLSSLGSKKKRKHFKRSAFVTRQHRARRQ